MKWYERLIRTGLLVLLTIIVLAGMPGGVRAQEASGLVAYYPFNGNANDKSGNDNHGIVYGANLTMDRFGGANSTYRFDGLDDYIDIGNNASLKMTDGLTISVWINLSSYNPKYQNIISDHAPNEGTVGPGKILRFNYNNLQFIVGGVYGYGTAIYVNYTFDNNMLGKWQHVVSTYDRNIVRLYVNGVEVDSRQYTAPLTVNSNHVLIGKSGYGEYLNGFVDDVRIYNRALSPEEIQVSDVTLTALSSRKTVENINASHSIGIFNSQYNADTFYLTISNPDNAAVAALDQSSITIPPWGSKEVTLNVTDETPGEGSISDNIPPQSITNPSLQAAGTTLLNFTWAQPLRPRLLSRHALSERHLQDRHPGAAKLLQLNGTGTRYFVRTRNSYRGYFRQHKRNMGEPFIKDSNSFRCNKRRCQR